MTSWEALSFFRDILITNYFGSTLAFYIGIMVLFIVALMMAGLDFRLAIVFSIPLDGAYILNGVFGANTWAGLLVLAVAGIIYAYVIIDLFT